MLGCIPRTPSPESEDVDDDFVAPGSTGDHKVRQKEIQNLRVCLKTRQPPPPPPPYYDTDITY